MDNRNLIQKAAETALTPNGLDPALALALMDLEASEEIFFLLAQANLIRHRTVGNKVELCAIVNARSGLCPEDCAFCAQSARRHLPIETYPLMEPAAIVTAAAQAKSRGVSRFSIVTSGRGLTVGADLERVAEAVAGIAALGLSPCASLGIVDEPVLARLVTAGLKSYHHNLETAPSYYGHICTTHSFAERMETALLARRVGLRLCSGGIIGLGETRIQRVEFALTLRELAPDSIPLNFYHHVAGGPLGSVAPLSPLEILKSIAIFRLLLPRADLRACGGREAGLRGVQPLMFLAGVNSTMAGNYLTTSGRSPAEDQRDILDLGLELSGPIAE